MDTKYKTSKNGISYTTDTPDDIIEALDRAIKTRSRIIVKYKDGYEDFSGYTKDGLTHHIYVGNSTGNIKIPLSIISKKSTGGSSILTSAIEFIKFK